MAKSRYSRKKRPESVRRALLDQAARLAVEQGLAAVTVQAVADAVGVTKGGLTHHFPNKRSLLDAVIRELVAGIDREIDQRIEADSEAYGSFTRAYIEAVFQMSLGADGGPWAALSISVLTDPSLRALWADWFHARLEQHKATDGQDVQLAAARLAADGVWLADLAGVRLLGLEALRTHLLESTRERA